MIESIKEFFSDKLDAIDFILLYGSYAKGTQTPMSDIDIAIHFNTPPSLLTIGGYITHLEMLLHKKVEINTLNNLYKTHPLLAYNITTDHLPIEIINQEQYVAFKTSSMLYYFDVLPLLEQKQKALKRRIDEGRFGERSFEYV